MSPARVGADEQIDAAVDACIQKLESRGELTREGRRQIESFRRKAAAGKANREALTSSGHQSNEPPVVRRDSVVAEVSELAVRPDDSGFLTFRIRNQRWEDVLEWCSAITGKTYSWTSLPESKLSVGVDRPVSVEDAESVIAGCLLKQGFACCPDDQLVLISELGDLDATVLTFVKPTELGRIPKNYVVKTRFPTGRIAASRFREELEAILGLPCQVVACPNTNTLVLLGTARELRFAYRLICVATQD